MKQPLKLMQMLMRMIMNLGQSRLKVTQVEVDGHQRLHRHRLPLHHLLRRRHLLLLRRLLLLHRLLHLPLFGPMAACFAFLKDNLLA